MKLSVLLGVNGMRLVKLHVFMEGTCWIKHFFVQTWMRLEFGDLNLFFEDILNFF